jgi:hypothetical protein
LLEKKLSVDDLRIISRSSSGCSMIIDPVLLSVQNSYSRITSLMFA